MDNRYINQIEVLVNLFTISKGKLNVLLFRKEEEPFKGYWMLPSNLLMTTETIEECAKYTINEMAGIDNIYLKQCNVFSKIDKDEICVCSLICTYTKTYAWSLYIGSDDLANFTFEIPSSPNKVFNSFICLSLLYSTY